MSLATVQDLQDRLRVDVDAIQAQAVLDAAEAEIVWACQGWQLTDVDGTEVDLQGTGRDVLFVPAPPVRAVTSVVDDEGSAVTGWVLKSTVQNRRRADRLQLTSGTWNPDRVYTVTYDHGFTDDDRPVFLKELCLRLALRMWVNPEQVMQKRRGDYSMSFGSSAVEASGLTKYELAMLGKAGLRPTSR